MNEGDGMKQPFSDKHTIAWFKIAEYISRGEKERALGVYRLLSHSLDDAAYAKQLEGDILLSCNDQSAAITRYKDAALLYQKNNRLLQAAAIYEHLLLLFEEDQLQLARLQLIDFYAILINYPKLIFHAIRVAESAAKNQDWNNMDAWLSKVNQSIFGEANSFFYKEIVIMLVSTKSPSELIKKYLKELVTICKHHQDLATLKDMQSLLKDQKLSAYELFCEILLEENVDIV